MSANLGLYVLRGKEPVAESDSLKWAKWFASADRTVRRTELRSGSLPWRIFDWLMGMAGVRPSMVSTVFLGTDHSFGDPGGPLLFETMVFGGKQDGFQLRWRTWSQAEKGHDLVVCLLIFGALRGGRESKSGDD